ncbi:uncharacterized protein HD556DRAFT_1435459 [Suillus plorans]|uniref:CxC2-like cysteine cluster KDZ transposase-associated domain-containing protein n=1 Tax=Suillus plorans TaxID=116603 RepID=A0A9P7D8Q9_9AGAM|nr:uncharacterized protein HD556DRAFT_1435459 [Suillus plorans]KAG1784380.1 hypothetical protein HD556DRAFT_1435459 [Suillus plorans]
MPATIFTERSSFLDEMIRLEGRGDEIPRGTCSCKGEEPLLYRCKDCFGVEMVCRACILQRHVHNPLHRVELLGLRIQLGHNPGETCYNPEPAAGDDFVVIDVHGIHEIGLDFCGCETAQIHYKQLIRARWFPATTLNPQTAATFALMEFFHLLTFESKVSAYEFYHSIARRTDNTGTTPIRDRYSAFMRMVRQWRHLKMLKRAGRGHDPSGVDATSAGECAVLCPACPHPGKNLPEGWEDASHDIRWKYALFLAIDANFRLKRKLVSSDNVDPSLNAGSCYFVEENAYKQYLSERGCEPQEKSSCVSHNAVNMADTKSSRGLAATGVGTVDCARHDMKLPNGVGDLQKGERYLNMDYLVFSVMVGFAVVVFNLSYDIACQWHKKLWPRMASMPPRLHLTDRDNKTIRFFVPKFHLNAHVQSCQTAFSFNFGKNVGRTDGEAPERGWANINRVASSTKEMGPGTCRDTLDDHFSDWNWKKVTMLGQRMLRKVKEASRRAKLHREELSELQRSIPASSLSVWKLEIEAWEEDSTQPNPFESRVIPMTQAAVRRQLAEKEAVDLQAGVDVSLHADISPSLLIASGIDLQDQQRRLAADISALGQHATDIQKTKIFNQSNALQRRLDMWAQIQVLYMPAVAPIRAMEDACRSEGTAALKPESFQLRLPSQLAPHLPCNQQLRECEWELRYAQAHDALNDVRQHIRLFTHLNTFRTANVRGQRASTRARTALNLAEQKKRASKAKYDAARDALTALAPLLGKFGWTDIMRPLGWTDMRPMGDFIQGQSEGTRDIPWIWKTPGVLQDNDEGLQDCLRIEWCKARAQEARWSEELLLLLEEMQRVLMFLTWQGTWWSGLASARHQERLADSEGSRAYANRQSALREAMAEKFRQRWAIVPAVVAAELDDDGTLDIADTDSTMLTIEGPPPLAVED